MTAATCATRTENMRLIQELTQTVKPKDLTDDELVAMVEMLKAARDRKRETRPGVVDLDLVRSVKRTRRKGKIFVPSARHQPPWWRADSTPRARLPQGTGRVQQLRRMQLRRRTLRRTPARLSPRRRPGPR
jgi:hypothetical protein